MCVARIFCKHISYNYLFLICSIIGNITSFRAPSLSLLIFLISFIDWNVCLSIRSFELRFFIFFFSSRSIIFFPTKRYIRPIGNFQFCMAGTRIGCPLTLPRLLLSNIFIYFKLLFVKLLVAIDLLNSCTEESCERLSFRIYYWVDVNNRFSDTFLSQCGTIHSLITIFLYHFHVSP